MTVTDGRHVYDRALEIALSVSVTAILIILTAAIVYYAVAAGEKPNPEPSGGHDSYYPGQPISMVVLDAPEWSASEHMYRLIDSTYQRSWLVIRLWDGQWHVLDATPVVPEEPLG